MRTNCCLKVVLAVAACMLLGVSVKANTVNSISGGTVISFAPVNAFGGGPETVAPGITWSSTNLSNQGGSVYGYTGGYAFESNGNWDGALGPMVGLNDSTFFYGVTDTMTFAFSTPVAAVGGFLNYVPDSGNPTTIAVYNSADVLIESYNLTFVVSGSDQGQFIGFSEPTTDISYFTLTDNYIGLTDFTVSADPVSTTTPEPGSLVLLGSGGLSLLGFLRRRK
jgi:PEP-CTERM motif